MFGLSIDGQKYFEMHHTAKDVFELVNSRELELGTASMASLVYLIDKYGLYKIVFLLRLSPIFPFNLLNYALGLTAIRFRDYCIASIGMIPASLLYVYYGKVAGDLARLAAGQESVQGTAYYGILGIGLIATIAVTAFVTRIARRALEDVTENQA